MHILCTGPLFFEVFMGLRTATEVQAEYNAVRTAYLNALEAVKLDHSGGTSSRAIERQNISDLRKQMDDLSREHDRLSRGSTITVRQGVPSGR
jgi:hypothetical protein